jgi:hypothetical protein
LVKHGIKFETYWPTDVAVRAQLLPALNRDAISEFVVYGIKDPQHLTIPCPWRHDFQTTAARSVYVVDPFGQHLHAACNQLQSKSPSKGQQHHYKPIRSKIDSFSQLIKCLNTFASC